MYDHPKDKNDHAPTEIIKVLMSEQSCIRHAWSFIN